MVPHRSRSHRTIPILSLALVVTATLLSCGRGADTPPASNEPAAASPAPTARATAPAAA